MVFIVYSIIEFRVILSYMPVVLISQVMCGEQPGHWLKDHPSRHLYTASMALKRRGRQT